MIKKLLSPEETKSKKVAFTAEYLKHAEDVLSELLGPISGPDTDQGTEHLYDFLPLAEDVRKLVMALRRYPKFDVRCLARLRQEDVDINGTKAKIHVPAFGISEYHGSSHDAEFYPAHPNLGNHSIPVILDHDLLAKDRVELERISRSQNTSGFRLRSACPAVPVDVQSRVRDAAACFSRTFVAWEASWEPAPPKDPLIIGEVLGHYFLIDQYDASKLERYVSSEMTTRPPAVPE
jgi:hypothetical protein